LYLNNLPAAQAEEQSALPPVSVHVVTVTPQETVASIEVVGTVEAVEKAVIAAKVTGSITDIPVVLGSRVKKNDLLVQISAEEISAGLLQAKAQLAQARRNLEREKKLLQKNATTRETVKAMQDMFDVAEAGFQAARTMLGYTTIIAPFDGVVTRKIAHAGDLATPGTPLLMIENDKILQVVAGVPEGLVVNIQTGDRLAVHVPAADLHADGIVAEIAPTTDFLSRTSPVKIDIDPTSGLRTGQFARVGLPGEKNISITVPASALVSFGQMEKIFVAVDGKTHLRLVRSGGHFGNQVEILAGLEPGEQVIVDNNRLLVDGQPIVIRP